MVLILLWQAARSFTDGQELGRQTRPAAVLDAAGPQMVREVLSGIKVIDARFIPVRERARDGTAVLEIEPVCEAQSHFCSPTAGMASRHVARRS